MFKGCFFLYEEFMIEKFMIEKFLFLHLLHGFDVTKNILEHKTLKSLLLDALKVALFIYASQGFIFFFFKTRNFIKF